MYDNFPNACFKCHKQRESDKGLPRASQGTSLSRIRWFYYCPKKKTYKPRIAKLTPRNFNKFSPLLNDVELPLLMKKKRKLLHRLYLEFLLSLPISPTLTLANWIPPIPPNHEQPYLNLGLWWGWWDCQFFPSLKAILWNKYKLVWLSEKRILL